MRSFLRAIALGAVLAVSSLAAAWSQPAVAPLLSTGRPVDWWFAYKFNAYDGDRATNPADPARECLFGGALETGDRISQRYIVADSGVPRLREGGDLIGMRTSDPLGATFEQIRRLNLNYVIWNDQFYGDPRLACGASCSGRWAHAKGLLAWNNLGEGFILQVSTPSWPRAGGAAATRLGNTLGCISEPNNLANAQHFFALRLTHEDVTAVVRALARAQIVTDRTDPERPPNAQIIRNGGPLDIVREVERLGRTSTSVEVMDITLSTGVRLIVKPPRLQAPPWQLVSSVLGNEPLRTATWWGAGRIPTTRAGFRFACWPADRPPPGRVEVATSGDWNGPIGLVAGRNHAKLGVSLPGGRDYVIFGDMNQEGAVFAATGCGTRQNGRGGLFFVVQSPQLAADVRRLIGGETAAYPVCRRNRACVLPAPSARLR